jgi:unsaturated rhamnogalacturonyl hydrolase
VETIEKEKLLRYLELLGNSFEKSLNLTDEEYLSGIADRTGSLEELLPFKNWDWTQGVGLYGFWQLFLLTDKKEYLNIIISYFDRYLLNGLPGKNINSICPMLTMAFLWEYSKDDKYKPHIIEWANWIMNELPRTEEGGFQHITAEYLNNQEIWADTVFMAVLFLAKAGVLLRKEQYIREAEYQILIHIKYLTNRSSGLLYHGWTFRDKNHFAKAFWCRGNCWYTLAIPEFLAIIEPEPAVKKMLVNTLIKQVDTLERLQASNGLWHTLLDHDDSYLEVSGSAGIAAGILKSCRMNLIPKKRSLKVYNALNTMLNNIDEKGNVLNVSIGTPMGRESLDFYKDVRRAPMPYGQALMMLYLLEVYHYNSGDLK